MSIASEITRINNNIASAYSKVEEKGGTLPETQNSANLATAIDSISGGGVGEKTVLFFDYDGTIIYDYTKEEFLQLNSLPNNPTHTGLTAQGWNWSLSDAKNYVRDYGRLNIAQMYITDDEKTRIYIHLEGNNLQPYLGFGINGTATVDWGDGTSEQITGNNDTSIYYIKNTPHTYASAGDYVISISNNVTIAFYGFSSYTSRVIWSNNSSYNDIYTNSIKKVELGKNVKLGDSAFRGCHSLKTITIPNNLSQTILYEAIVNDSRILKFLTIPNNITKIYPSIFTSCSHIEHISIPNSITSLGSGIFNGCYALEELIIPNSVTALSESICYNCYNLINIVIPNSVTTIKYGMFSNCIKLKNITIPNNITTIEGSVFNENKRFTKCNITK